MTIVSKLRNLLRRLKENEHVSRFTSQLPPLNFITVHYSYFILTCLLCSVIFWSSSGSGQKISYTDSLFLVISAMTEAGLNTVNLSEVNTFQQVLLWILIIVGSSIFVSISTVWTRKRVFENRFKNIVKSQKGVRRFRKQSISSIAGPNTVTQPGLKNSSEPEGPVVRYESNIVPPEQGISPQSNPVAASGKPSSDVTDSIVQNSMESLAAGTTPNIAEIGASPTEENVVKQNAQTEANHISFMRYGPSPTFSQRRFLTFSGVGAHPNATGYKSPYSTSIYNRIRRGEQDQTADRENLSDGEYPHYLTRTTTGRNSQFHGLSQEQREHLGGVEYRAITLLSWIVPLYFVLWQFIGSLGLAAYIAHNKAETAQANGINPW